MSINPEQLYLDMIRRLVPRDFATLSSSSEACLEKTGDPDPTVRYAAIIGCRAIWRLDRDNRFVSRCCEIIVSDADWLPVHGAIDQLTCAFSGSKDRQLQKLMANVALDAGRRNAIRNIAYQGALEIGGHSADSVAPSQWDELLENDRRLSNGEDVPLTNFDAELLENILNDVDD